MSETLVGLFQGIATGVGILGAAAAIFFAAPVSGNVQLVVNDQVVAINRSARVNAEAQPVSVTKTMDAPQQPEAAAVVEPEAVVEEPEAASGLAAIQYAHDPAYYNQTAADLYLMVVSLQRMKILLDAPRPESEGWRTEMTGLISAVHLSADRLVAVTPSAANVEIHGFLAEAAARCARVTLALDGDLSLLPVETFALASGPINSCSGEVLAVLQAIN